MPNGAISFLSKCWGRRATDRFICQNCGFLQLVEHGNLMLADRVFDIADDLGVFGAHLHEASNSLVCKKNVWRGSQEFIHTLNEKFIGVLKTSTQFCRVPSS